MARSYTVATTALALSTSVKWVDNIISHFRITGVTQSRQGVSRKISPEAILRISLANRLAESLRTPLGIALGGADILAEVGRWDLGGGLSLYLDRAVAGSELESKLGQAVEAAPLPRRGRPPGKAKRGA